jgi:hypothetical protein
MARSPFADYLARFDAGDTIFRAGDPARTLFVVQSGAVDLTGAGGEPLATLERGDFFGEMSLLEGTPRTFTATAKEPVEAIEIGPALFDRMIRGNIELAVRMLRKLSLRLADTEARLGRAPGPQAAAPPAPEPPPPAAVAPPVRPVSPAPPAGESPAVTAAAAATGVRAWLVQTDGQGRFPLDGETVRVGRFDPVTGTRPEVDLTLLDLKRSVSRRHAVLVLDDGGYLLTEEVGALNGTTVNGQAVDSAAPVRVADGDDLAFGAVTLRFQLQAP